MPTSVLVIAVSLTLAAVLSAAPSDWTRRVALGGIVVSGVTTVWTTTTGSWFAIDRLGQLLAVSALAIGGGVLAYAQVQFRGETRARTLIPASYLVLLAVVALDFAATLRALVISWIAVSLAVTILLALADGRGPLRRLTALTFLVGDGLLLIATAFTGALTHDTTGALSNSAGAVVTLAAVVAAAGRAGLWIRRSWVVDTINAPTPVSALLHAGVVNGGAILLCRLAHWFPPRAWFAPLAVIVSLAVMLRLSHRISARVDLKGQLAMSTVSQMSFMFCAIGLGHPVLAVTHLIGHGAYKAVRFLGATGAIGARADRATYRRVGQVLSDPTRLGSTALLALSALILASLVGGDGPAALSVMGTGLCVLWWRRSAAPLALASWWWFLTWASLVIYALVISVVDGLVGSTLSSLFPATSWWTVGAVVALLAVTHARRENHEGRKREIVRYPATSPTHLDQVAS